MIILANHVHKVEISLCMHAEIFRPPPTQKLGAVDQRAGVYSSLAVQLTCMANHSADHSQAHVVQVSWPGDETVWLQQHVLQYTSGQGAVLHPG